MGRALFIIDNKKDRNNFLTYLKKHRENVLLDLREYHRLLHVGSAEVSLEKEKEFISLWETISDVLYVRDTPQDKIWEDVTTLLYLLPPKRIETIKISLRAKLYREKHRNKSQLTIDKDVYSELSSFASNEGLTLSDAIAALLIKQNV